MPPSSLLLPPWTLFGSSGALRLTAGPLREPGGPQLPRVARCCYPPGPFSSPRERSASRRDRSASQGVRSCLAWLVAATPLDPFRLLGSAPPHGGTAPRARGSAAASLGSLLLPPWTLFVSSGALRLTAGPLREPGGPQLPRLARCCYPPGPFSSPRERSASRRDRSASQGVRSCLAWLVAATPLDPFRLLGSAPPHGGTAPRARGSAAASLGSLLLPPWTLFVSSGALRLTAGPLREPGGPQLPRLPRCCYPPRPFSSPRECSASRRTAPRARGSAAASLGSLLLPPWTLFVAGNDPC